MFSQSGDVSHSRNSSLRFATALLIPAILIVWLLYAAQTQEETLHGRNLRWLAQMATQISDRVDVRSKLVADRSHPAGQATAANQSGQHNASRSYSIENLEPLDPKANSDKCKPANNLTVSAEGQEWQLLFVQKNACAQSDLKDLVKRAIRKDAFTSVILAQRDGTVLYQSGPESLRITDVGFLFTKSSEGKSKRIPGTSATPPKDAPGASDAPTTSIHLTNQVGDANFEVFAQPLLLRAQTQLNGNDWILIGISEKHNLLRSSAPNGLMLVVPLVVLLLGMIWPLQRLWSMPPFESLRRRQLVAIGMGSLGVVAILSLLGVYEYSRHLSMERSDQQLGLFAQALGRNFKTELRLAVDQLHELDKIATPKKAEFKARILEHSLKPTDVRLPFEFVDWIDGKGNKIIRWTTKDTLPQSVNVADRAYFKEISNAAGNRLRLPEISDEEFTIEQVLSRTSGEALTILGIRSKLKQTSNIQVASLAVNLVSLSEPVAPRDLGFAIADSSARVLFHSDPSRVFVENLFEESPDSEELRGVVSRRIPAFLNLNYNASPHRMLITPIPGLERLPWTLVVFRKLSGNRVGRMQILVDASTLLLVYGVGVLLAVTLGWYLARRIRPRYTFLERWWMTFDPGRMYVAGVGFLLLLMIWRAFDRVRGSDLLWAAIGSSVAFLLINALGLRYAVGGSRPSVRWKLFRMTGVPAVLATLGLSLGDPLMAVAAPAFAVMWDVVAWRLLEALPNDRHPRALHAAWLVWGVELALVLCVAPTLLLSRLSYQYEVGLRLRDSQLRLWSAEAQKRRTVMHDIEQTPGVPENKDMRERLLAAVQLSGDPALKPLYYYGTDTSRISLLPGNNAVRDQQCGPNAPPDSGPKVPLTSALTELILPALELPNEDRLMGVDARRRSLEPAGKLWTWRERGSYLCLQSDAGILASAELPVFDPFRFRPDVVQASSGPQESPAAAGTLVSSGPVWLGLIAMLGAVAVWMNILRRRLLLIGVSKIEGVADPAYDDSAPVPSRLFLIAEPGARQQILPQNLSSYQRIDLALDEFRLDANGAQKLPATGLLLDRFETRFHDPKVRMSRLELMEAALLAGATPIAIRSAIDCVTFLAGSGADEDELRRWHTVVNHFERRVRPRGTEAALDYATIWDSCSQRERDVLLQVCRHGLVNPGAAEVVGVLLRRGLLRRGGDLELRFFHQEFHQFVAYATILEREKKSPRLGRGRLPVYVIALLLLGFVLLFSQEELTARLIGFLTTMTGGFEAVRKQIAGVREMVDTEKS